MWNPFPARSPNLAAFLPASAPELGRRKVPRICRARSALRRLLRWRRSGVLAIRSSRSKSACASRSTSAHFYRYAAIRREEPPMPTREFNTINPAAFGEGDFDRFALAGTHALKPKGSQFPSSLNELARVGCSDKICRVGERIPACPLPFPASPRERPSRNAGKRAGCSRLSAGQPIPAFGLDGLCDARPQSFCARKSANPLTPGA